MTHLFARFLIRLLRTPHVQAELHQATFEKTRIVDYSGPTFAEAIQTMRTELSVFMAEMEVKNRELDVFQANIARHWAELKGHA